MTETFETDEPIHFRFDEFLNIGSDQRHVVSDWLRPICDAGRVRARRTEEVAKFEQTLGLIVANALSAWANPRGPACYYSRATGTYTANGSYNPSWLSFRILIDTVDKLHGQGLLTGRRGRPTGLGDGQRSTFLATPAFIGALEQREIALDHVVRDHAAAPVLVLKGPEFQKRKPWRNYPRNAPQVQALELPVRVYNEFIRGHALSWNFADEELTELADRQADNGGRFVPPDLSRTDLRRVYNEDSWEMGGRFYGGWWQQIPSDTRSLVRIDGEPTVELDYGGFLPRAIYHQEGLPLVEDAYEIPAIKARSDRQNQDWEGLIRPSIKKMFAVILNTRSTKGRSYVKGITLPRGLSYANGYRLIEKHHQAIEAWFYQGRGIALMNRESNLCQRILTAGVQEGVVVLPVHDSFLVRQADEGWLRDKMCQTARKSDPRSACKTDPPWRGGLQSPGGVARSPCAAQRVADGRTPQVGFRIGSLAASCRCRSRRCRSDA